MAMLQRSPATGFSLRRNAFSSSTFPISMYSQVLVRQESQISKRIYGIKYIPYEGKCCRMSSSNVCSSLLFTVGASLKTLSSETCFSIQKQNRRGNSTVATKASKDSSSSQANDLYKNTLDLPKTSFSLKANSVVREPEIQKLWEENQLWRQILNKNNGDYFTLHDGPPYANGNLHIGHALNKILKDFINRYKLLQNYKVKFVPGWDCHGLPIELKVLQSMEPETRKDLTPLKLRKKAAQFAMKTVNAQRNSFKRYGVWGDWDNPYLTLSPEYEAAQIELFGQMVLSGHIYRGRKPVHWSPSSGTALAEAELEYPEGHISKSIFATFKFSHITDKAAVLKEFLPDLSLTIWTTTPWTIPGNAAVAVNGDLSYAVVEVHSLTDKEGKKLSNVQESSCLVSKFKSDNKPQYLIVAEGLVSSLQQKWGIELHIKKIFTGSVLEHCRYAHPIEHKECPVVIGGDYITTESGTGLVHTAPGHGLEDFVTGLKYGLPVISPVDDSGRFTEEAGQFSGLDVLADGNIAVINALDEKFSLIMEERYAHKYPYDWRTKKPTIFRATEQWFASVEGFRQAALEAIKQVNWIPSQGENRITSMTASRSDWCISRQRAWGVPIPVFYHVDSGEALMNNETITHIKSIIAHKGGDAWWYMSTDQLLPEVYRSEAHKYIKGTDTMDVWFDSGSSWAAVVNQREGLAWPSDLYLEGSDQHRGWFQSSLLTSIATRGQAPFKSVLTHGFVLDERGHKMSKSVGNVVDPTDVIEGGKNQKEQVGYGADVLRLWVSSVDYTSDVLIGPQVLKQMSDVYRKLRGTLRYLLSNLHDWNTEVSVPYNVLPMIDKYALFQLANVIKSVEEGYENYQFYKVFQILQRFAVVDLSNFYFDVAKDRLYVGGKNSATRRSCQSVLAAHLLCIVRVVAPILPHLAEDAWQHLPFSYAFENNSPAKFVFEARWPKVDKSWLSLSNEEVELWTKILEVRTEVNRVLEMARAGKLIGANLDAKVFLFTSDADFLNHLTELSQPGDDADRLKRVFITSQVEIIPSLEQTKKINTAYSQTLSSSSLGDLWVGVTRANGNKCERCWNYSEAVGTYLEHPALCERCYRVINIEAPSQQAVAA